MAKARGRPRKSSSSASPAKSVAKSQSSSQTKLQPNDDSMKKRKKNKNYSSFRRFIYKVLKQVHNDIGINGAAMIIMNDMMIDIFQKLAGEASNLVKLGKKPTLLSRDIQSAVRFLLPGELAKHAMGEGTKAVKKYMGLADDE